MSRFTSPDDTTRAVTDWLTRNFKRFGNHRFDWSPDFYARFFVAAGVLPLGFSDADLRVAADAVAAWRAAL